MQINWVKQEDPHGCGPACLAMLTGKKYSEVLEWFKRPDFKKQGITKFEMDHYLVEHGYAIARKWPFTQNEEYNKRRGDWPPEPFAAVHLCQVFNDGNYHFVVMLADGTCLDPLTPQNTRLSDYKDVSGVAAIHCIKN